MQHILVKDLREALSHCHENAHVVISNGHGEFTDFDMGSINPVSDFKLTIDDTPEKPICDEDTVVQECNGIIQEFEDYLADNSREDIASDIDKIKEFSTDIRAAFSALHAKIPSA